MRDLNKEYNRFWRNFPGGFAIAVAIVVAFVTLALIVAYTKPAFIQVNREAVQQSQEYVETKQGVLLGLLGTWRQLDSEIAVFAAQAGNEKIVEAKRAQQKAVIGQMRAEAAKIPTTKVPPEIKLFLAGKQ